MKGTTKSQGQKIPLTALFDSIENTVGPKSLSKGELIETLEENLT